MRSRFDAVLGNSTSQDTVYELLKTEVTSSLFTGYNATVFAYGQTGSGKTYTMEGTKNDRGLIPRLVNEIFNTFKEKSDVTNASVKMSYVQIYQDQIQDLLQSRKLLDIKLDKAGHYIANGALWKDVTSSSHAMQIYTESLKNRATSATEMNLISSRSHALLQFQLKWDEPLAPGSNAKLNLIDLAGSEKVALSGASGEILKEAIAINKSLSALSNVVKALVDQAKDPAKRVHIPYKDSKLTYLLQSSLGGNNLIHFILCLSASILYRNEGSSTVEFGKRALKVVLKPVKNPIDYRRLEEMERMIEQMRQHISELEGKLSQKTAEPLPPAKQGGEEFLAMEIIKQDDAEPQEAETVVKQREAIKAVISQLETQQKSVEERLSEREQEITQLKKGNVRERATLQSQFNEEKRRYTEEMNTLRSNVKRQQECLNEKEMEFKKARDLRARKKSIIHSSKVTSKLRLKTNLELERIYRMLPESLHELTSHCILFPQSKARFRELGGLKKLLGLIDCKGNKGRESYIAHAAYALSIALDEEGRDEVRELGGVAAVSDVLSRTDEHSKQFACRALEALVRGNSKNKEGVVDSVLLGLANLVGTHPHQQVQEAACSALAEIADSQPNIKAKLMKNGLLEKMISLIRDTPPEVADLIKVGVTVIGRLAQQHAACQNEIARLNGVALLVGILFSNVGDRDPQLPVLTAYALVNICCNNKDNMLTLQKHPRYKEIKFKLLEGLGRVFSDNIANENRISATASHVIKDGSNVLFGYHGVTCKSEWSTFTAGGRPTYSTFMENPQFVLHVPTDSNISIVLSDTSCEDKTGRNSSKRKTIYMGISVFNGDRALLCDKGLKQLDFNGKFVTSGRYNRNRENTLSLPLKGSPDPYVIVPFTAHLLQHTSFVLGVFSDNEVEVAQVPEEGGWVKRVFEGRWTKKSGRGVDSFDWRNNDQYVITVSEVTTLVAVLSYRKIDDFRLKQALAADDEEISEDDPRNEEKRERPHLHGRVFASAFAPDKRYVRSNIPSPQNTTFETCNEYLSTSSVKTTMTLHPNNTYVFIPFTETPIEDDYRIAFYSDNDEVNMHPLGLSMEWYAFQYTGIWPTVSDSSPDQSPFLIMKGGGKVVVIGHSKDVYLLLTIYEITDDTWKEGSPVNNNVRTKKLISCDAFWANECVLEAELPQGSCSYWVTLQGIKTAETGEQKPVTAGSFNLAVYVEDIGTSVTSPYTLVPSSLIDRLNAKPENVGYGWEKLITGGIEEVTEVTDEEDDSDDSTFVEEMESKKRNAEVEELKQQLHEKQNLINNLSKEASTTPQPPSRRNSSHSSSRRNSTKVPARVSSGFRGSGSGSNAAKTLRNSTPSTPTSAASVADMTALSSASEQLVKKISSFASLSTVPTPAEFKKLQEDLLQAADKLSVTTRRATAP
eukprot:TRINITY_DN17205_c0_g1_i1.p1 TRINITY_DN17205_c0_g1~~TRINITY_DN17205_c0_g1_i1.p1  ORF type:complete len:1472 (+),score=381.61 TRINITY_DN17205_c0_g1_i1:179-4417(+)